MLRNTSSGWAGLDVDLWGPEKMIVLLFCLLTETYTPIYFLIVHCSWLSSDWNSWNLSIDRATIAGAQSNIHDIDDIMIQT